MLQTYLGCILFSRLESLVEAEKNDFLDVKSLQRPCAEPCHWELRLMRSCDYTGCMEEFFFFFSRTWYLLDFSEPVRTCGWLSTLFRFQMNQNTLEREALAQSEGATIFVLMQCRLGLTSNQRFPRWHHVMQTLSDDDERWLFHERWCFQQVFCLLSETLLFVIWAMRLQWKT